MAEVKSKKKIVLVCNTSGNVVGFRRGLILRLKEEYDVSAIAFDRDCEKEAIELGVDFYCVGGSNRSLNPLKVFSLEKKYYEIIKKINPDVVFTFMLKPNIYATIAAKKAGVKRIISMVEGAGDAFTYDTFKWRMIRKYVTKKYKKAFKAVQKVFFLNEDDRDEFVNSKMVVKDKTAVIPGIGINLSKFTFYEVVNQKNFLMIARMLRTKGVYEYCLAAKKVKEIYPEAEFHYIGAECDVTVEQIEKTVGKGIVCFHGNVNDVRPFIKDSTVNVLPSYREGFGLVNAETGAMGRASITCNTNGTRDTVVDGYNGFLIKTRNVEELVQKMIYFIENPEKAVEMGNNARTFAEENFDQKVINERIYKVIEGK